MDSDDSKELAPILRNLDISSDDWSIAVAPPSPGDSGRNISVLTFGSPPKDPPTDKEAARQFRRMGVSENRKLIKKKNNRNETGRSRSTKRLRSPGEKKLGISEFITKFSELETSEKRLKTDRNEEIEFMQETGSELIFMISTRMSITEPPPRFMPYIC